MTILERQCALTLLGYPCGTPDGQDGPKTKAALKKFQNDYGACTDDAIANAMRLWEPKAAADSFWKNVRHFTREEFRCRCGKCGGFPAEPVEKLIMIADAIREKTDGKPAVVSSGVRCTAHNTAVGGVATSRHLKGWAMDFAVQGWTSTKLDAVVGSMPGVAYHYKIDNSYVHMDVVI